MRSVNTANRIGRELGRDISDVWIDDDSLRRLVRRKVGPKIRLLKSDEDRALETSIGLLVFSSLFTLIAVALTVVSLMPIGPMETASMVVALRGMIAFAPPGSVYVLTGAFAAVTLGFIIAASASRKRAKEARRRTVQSLYDAAFAGASAVLAVRRGKLGMAVESVPGRLYYPPVPRPEGVTPRQAEEVVAQWMRHLGEADAELTSFTGDGGIDVSGARSMAQVKHYSSAVGVSAIREFAGVAANDSRARQPLFFTSTGYARGATEFANSAGIALFVYNAEQGSLEAMNARAKTLVQNGIG